MERYRTRMDNHFNCNNSPIILATQRNMMAKIAGFYDKIMGINRQSTLLNSSLLLLEILLVSLYPFLVALVFPNRVFKLMTNLSGDPSFFIIYVFTYFIIGYVYQNYDGYRIRKWLDMFVSSSLNQITHFLSLSFIYLFLESTLSRLEILLFHVGLLFFIVAYRTILEWGLFKWFKLKQFEVKIAIVNYGSHAQKYAETIQLNPRFNQRVELTFSEDDSNDIQRMSSILSKTSIDLVLISDENKSHNWFKSVLAMSDYLGITSTYLSYSQSFLSANAPHHVIGDLLVSETRSVPLDIFLNRVMKRLMDVIISILALTLLSPVMLIIALLVKLTSKGPVFYRQRRVGFKNKPFNMLKFRTMRESQHESWVGSKDPRITKIGKFLRLSSLDELPQFFNILLGNMSVVGPRPERLDFVYEFSEKIEKYRVKHAVKPGLTGLAQINGFRGNTSLIKRIEYDIYYIENWSIFMDIYIIIRTLLFGFINKEEL